jgi:hypothetical protein
MGALLLAGCAGDDNTDDPYAGYIQINNLDNLEKIGNDDAYPLNGKYALTANITLTNWTPIGSDIEPFTGTFAGNNRTITLNSFYPGNATARYLGVFAYVNGATISDVKIDYKAPAIIGTVEIDPDADPEIDADPDINTYTGALAAYAKNSQFTDITVSGAITLTNHGTDGSGIEGGDGVNVAVFGGGIAGYVVDTVFTRCASSVAVTVTGNNNSSAGGIAGSSDNTEAFATRFISCSSSGAITATWHTSGGGNWGQLYAGGIIGNTQASWGAPGCLFENCYTTGNVTASSADNPYAGGIAGNFHGAGVIRGCYTTGAINAITNPAGSWNNGYLGGIAGNNSGKSLIENSYSTGAITLTGKGYVGGITGQNGSEGSIVRYCYATGAITSNNDTASVGGIVGQNHAHADNDVNGNAALNSAITAAATTVNVHRVVGENPTTAEVTAKVTNNIARSSMTTTGFTASDKGVNGLDGADNAALSTWATYSALGWNSSDSASAWKTTIPAGGYPVLAWQP